MTASIHVFLADDHPLIRAGLCAALAGAADMSLVGEAADGYVLKDEGSDELVRAIRAVAQGHSWFSPSIAAKVAHWAVDTGPAPPILTAREREVLCGVVESKSDREIAALLGVSEKAVEKHLHRLFAKLGVTSRVVAAVRAVREGLVEGRPDAAG